MLGRNPTWVKACGLLLLLREPVKIVVFYRRHILAHDLHRAPFHYPSQNSSFHAAASRAAVWLFRILVWDRRSERKQPEEDKYCTGRVHLSTRYGCTEER